MKTTYPPSTATSPAEWQTYSSKHINDWYMHINTQRDNPAQLDYATIERQIVALRLKLQNCSIKQYYPLKGKIEKLQRQLKDRRSNQAWEDYLAK
jgi:hypothetical protein